MDAVLEDEGSAVGALSSWLSEYKAEEEKTPKKGEKTQEAARALLEYERFATVGDDESVYRYHGDEGVWKDDGEDRIRRVLDAALGSEFSTRVLNETVERVRARTQVDRDEFDLPKRTVPVRNGLLDLETRDLRDLRQSDYATFRLPVRYDEDANCPEFHEYLKEVTRSGSDRKKLQEYVGYVLMHGRMPHHKSLFLAGPQASGKSTFIGILSALLPEEVRGASTPHQLTRRFGKAVLRDRWLNVSADIPSSMIENTGMFKLITGKDVVDAELKGVQKKLTFTPTTKHVFSANQLPEVYEADEAFWRRILIVPFPESIPREDRVDNLDEELVDREASGILNWMLNGYERLAEQGGFTADLTPEETRKLWLTWSTSVVRFYSRCLKDDMDGAEKVSDVYDAYKSFSDKEGLTPKSKEAFGKSLLKFPHIGKAKTGRASDQRAYTNIQLRDDVK
nr:phage/plasmid primase, P4 family [Halorutilus salinus]